MVVANADQTPQHPHDSPGPANLVSLTPFPPRVQASLHQSHSCPAFTAIYTWSIASFNSSADPAVQIISPLVWQQVAIGYSLISSLLTALMPFLKSFHTGMGVEVRGSTTLGSSSGYMRGASRASRQNVSYRLDNLSKHRTTVTTQSGDDEEGMLRPDTTGYTAHIYGSKAQRGSGVSAPSPEPESGLSGSGSSGGGMAPIVMRTEISIESSDAFGGMAGKFK